MGLDNGFVLRSKSNKKLSIELSTFRKYYELDQWMMDNAQHTSEFEVIVTANDLKELLREINPIIDGMRSLSNENIHYYEDYGYPKKYHKAFCGLFFDPIFSQSFNAGGKIRRLKIAVESMLDIFENNSDDLYITFYSSF